MATQEEEEEEEEEEAEGDNGVAADFFDSERFWST